MLVTLSKFTAQWTWGEQDRQGIKQRAWDEQGFCVWVLDERIEASALMIFIAHVPRNFVKLNWKWIKSSMQNG